MVDITSKSTRRESLPFASLRVLMEGRVRTVLSMCLLAAMLTFVSGWGTASAQFEPGVGTDVQKELQALCEAQITASGDAYQWVDNRCVPPSTDATSAAGFFKNFFDSPLGQFLGNILRLLAAVVMVIAIFNVVKSRMKANQGYGGGGDLNRTVVMQLLPAALIASLLFFYEWIAILIDLSIRVLVLLFTSIGGLIGL